MPAIARTLSDARLERPTAAIDLPHDDADERGAPARDDLGPGRYLLGGERAFALTRDVTHVGRGMAADVRLDDHTVSARHAIVITRLGGAWILDDRSTNGTIVNGRAVDEAELHDGDVVVIGRVILTYRVV